MVNRKWLILLLVVSNVTITAQKPYLYFNKLTTQNGLSHNKVNCILQDRRGFIWLGTDDGLNRYDGQHFSIFRHQPNNKSTVSGNIITDLLEDAQGILWIATADGGLSGYDYRLPPSLQFKQYKHLPGDPKSIPINIVNALVQDKAGFLWLGSDGKSTLRFNKKTEQFEEPVKTGTKNILDLAIDKNGMLWAGRQGGGILKVNTATLQYEMDQRYANLYANLPHATVSSLFIDRRGYTWFGSWDKILYRHDPVTGEEQLFKNQYGTYDFPGDDILAFAEDAQERIWMAGRNNGLTLYDRKQHRFFNYRYDAALEGSVADNHVRSVFIDRSGMVWLGTNKGVSIYNPAQQSFVQTFLRSSNKNLLIYDFYVTGNHDLWIGTSDGLFIRRAGTDSFLPRKLVYNGNPLSVSKIFEAPGGTIYLGTNYSFFAYDAVKNKLWLLPNTRDDSVMYNIIESRVVSVVSDTIGGHPAMIVLPYGHFLAYYDCIEQRWISRMDTAMQLLTRFNLPDNLVRKIYKTKSGSIWLATGKYGLGKWKKGALPYVDYFRNDPLNMYTLSNNNVYDLAEDALGNLWVSTYGGGLNYFNTTTGKAIHIAVTNNLLEGLAVDSKGAVWMISNGNLHRYDPVAKTNTSFILPDLEKSGGISRSIYKDADGNMYVSGTNFFIAFKPEDIRETATQPAIYLTDFRIFNTSNSQLLFRKGIELTHQQNFFSVEFAAPVFFKGTVEYSYMLEGFDKDWLNSGQRNFANYSNLTGGDYLFKVRATDRKGNWSGESASIKITIIPPVWKRWWFYGLSAMLASAGAYMLYRYRINELLKRQAIRNKIAQDLHDSVGSTLSSISVYSQVAKIQQEKENYKELKNVVDKISKTSTDMISEMNDIVWSINPRNDSMGEILQRMESFARPLLQTRQIAFRFVVGPHVQQVNLSMEQRKNFYLIFKEAINNVLKYSGATTLEVSINLKQHQLQLTAQDDGAGFDTNETKLLAAKSLSGNGLNNMKRRAKEMKGECLISSAPGKGTTVMLWFPIA